MGKFIKMEKLRKVNSFSELKVGQIVVVMNCRQCGKAKCREMLIKYIPSALSRNPDTNKVENMPGFDIAPPCTNKPMILGAWTVNQGRVFLVEDGLEDTDGVEDVVVKKLETVE